MKKKKHQPLSKGKAMNGIPGFLRVAILLVLLVGVGFARTTSQTTYYNYGDYTRQPQGYQVIYDSNGNPTSIFYYDAAYQETGYSPSYNPGDSYYNTNQPTPSAFPDRQRADDLFKSYRNPKKR